MPVRTPLLSLSLLALLTLFAAAHPSVAEPRRHHALSLISTPKYGPDFKHFDYVNPNAPKGGAVRVAGIGSFDSLNPFILKGVSATGIGLIYEQLMSTSLQEPSTSYGQLAEWASFPDDYSSVTYKLRDAARWHDGRPVTPEDVIFTFAALKKGHPFYAQYYKNVVKVEKTGSREVTFRFNVKNNRELPMIVGEMTILPEHYWTGTDKSGKPRDISRTTLEPPLGSGPYRVKDVKPGRSIAYERVKDHWGERLPVNLGQNNFDEIRYEYFRDLTVSFEAFKANRLDFHRETSSKNWATGYDIKAVKEGWIKRQKVRLETSRSMQAFIFNTRRRRFADPRVRRAFNLAFDFEWANKNLFFGQYERVASYFQNTELAATGLPKGRELELLRELQAEVPPEMFTKPFANPVNGSQGALRKSLRRATRLLKQAGWAVKNNLLTNTETGEPMKVEFLIVSPLFERIIQPYARNLEKLGIRASIRLVDSAQYARRLDSFDFDLVVGTFAQSESPGNEQRDYWGSAAAGKNGSRNLIGISNPAVDKLIDRIIFAKDRAELVAATRALDRVLLWNHYLVPQWFAPYERIAYWSRYGQPETLPTRAVGFLQVWWYDEAAAKKLAAVR